MMSVDCPQCHTTIPVRAPLRELECTACHARVLPSGIRRPSRRFRKGDHHPSDSAFATVRARLPRDSSFTRPTDAFKPKRPRFIQFQGHQLDTDLHYQRYCTVRRLYLVQCTKNPLFCLETTQRLPELPLRAPPEAPQ